MSIIKTCARKLICMRGGQTHTHTHTHYLQTFELLVNGLQGLGNARLIIIGVTISLNCQSKQRGETKKGLMSAHTHTHISFTLSIFPSMSRCNRPRSFEFFMFPRTARHLNMTQKRDDLLLAIKYRWDSAIFPSLACCILMLDIARNGRLVVPLVRKIS